jgi:hypothetical protein
MTSKQSSESIAAAIDRLPNSAYGRRVKRRLTKLARRNPGKFWCAYLGVVTQPDQDFAADLREMLAEKPDQTFSDLRTILQRRYAVAQ